MISLTITKYSSLTLPFFPLPVPFLTLHDCRPEAIEQLEKRIIVPDDTKILLKKVGSLSAPTTSGKRKKLKRVRFRLPRTAFESISDSSDDDDDDDKAKKRGKVSKKKSSDDEEEFTVEAAEAELDDVDDQEEEEEKTEAGNDNGCSQCGTLSAKQLHEDEETGDLLCNTCHSARGRSAAGHGAAAAESGGDTCYHCGSDEAPKLHKHKDSGGWECVTCKRYRASHNGELRPARLFNRKARARATTTSPAAEAGNGAAGASGSTPLRVATPRNQQQQQNQILNRSSLAGPPGHGTGAGNQQQRQAVAQKRAFRLQERFCSHSTRLIKYFTTSNNNSAIMSTLKNSYNLNALGNSSNQVAIEILAAKGAGKGNTAWGDLQRQVIEYAVFLIFIYLF